MKAGPYTNSNSDPAFLSPSKGLPRLPVGVDSKSKVLPYTDHVLAGIDVKLSEPTGMSLTYYPSSAFHPHLSLSPGKLWHGGTVEGPNETRISDQPTAKDQ